MFLNIKRLICENQTVKYAVLSLSSVIGGVLCGLVGIGGGIILVPVFALTCSERLADKRDVFTCTLPAVIPMSALSAVRYFNQGCVHIQSSLIFLLPAAAGGIVGGLLLGKINVKLLNFIFSAIMIWSGISMLLP